MINDSDRAPAGAAGGAAPEWNRLDTTVPHPARRYNYWLGGKDNFAADRESGDAIAAAWPDIRTAVQENRRFLRRVVTHLANAGIRQFLDIGTGLPTADNTHEVAQRIRPQSRVVYVDNDPLVLAHARALLTSHPDGVTAYLDADLRNPADILTDKDLRATLDLTQPVGLLLIAILHFISDDDDPYGIVTELLDPLPPGSYLAVSHGTYDGMPPATAQQLRASARDTNPPFVARTHRRINRLFTGLTLVDPGVVSIVDWHADDELPPRPTVGQVSTFGGVAVKR
jgi:hypothetical protein